MCCIAHTPFTSTILIVGLCAVLSFHPNSVKRIKSPFIQHFGDPLYRTHPGLILRVSSWLKNKNKNRSIQFQATKLDASDFRLIVEVRRESKFRKHGQIIAIGGYSNLKFHQDTSDTVRGQRISSLRNIELTRQLNLRS